MSNADRRATRGDTGRERILLIVNPNASRVDRALVAHAEAQLSRVAHVVVRFTEYRGHATSLVSDQDRFTAICVLSGDGCANEVINGLEGQSPPVGFIPGGHTNVLPRALGFSRVASEAVLQITRAVHCQSTKQLTLGRANGRLFSFAAGIGLDAELMRRVDDLRAQRGGRAPSDLRFGVEALRLLAPSRFRLDPSLCIVGFGPHAFALVVNTDPLTYAGSIPIHAAPRASFELGFDLVAMTRVRPVDIPFMLAALLIGRRDPRSPRFTYAHDLQHVQVRCDVPLPLQVDGEVLGDIEEVDFSAVPNALLALIPAPPESPD